MTERARQIEETRARILEAALSLFMRDWVEDISLRSIAAEAGVALQTVVRHFGTREQLFQALSAELRSRAERQRFAAPVGDVADAVAKHPGLDAVTLTVTKPHGYSVSRKRKR